MTFPSLLIGGGGKPRTAGINTATPVPTSVTASGTLHTKGAWSQLTASTDVDAFAVTIWMYSKSNNRRHLTDIGIGATSSEVVLIPNLGYITSTSSAKWLIDPVTLLASIPAGTRISARTQSEVTSAVIEVGMMLHQAPLDMSAGLQRCVAYGADTANTRGTLIDPGGTANTKGSWVELTASCNNPIRSLVVNSYDQNTLPTNCSWELDIGVGAGGSEVVVVGDLAYQANTTSIYTNRPIFTPPLPLDIPPGTRIAARNKCTITDATDRVQRIAIHCMD